MLRNPQFALGAARRAYWSTYVLRTAEFALGAALLAHAATALACLGGATGMSTGFSAMYLTTPT